MTRKNGSVSQKRALETDANRGRGEKRVSEEKWGDFGGGYPQFSQGRIGFPKNYQGAFSLNGRGESPEKVGYHFGHGGRLRGVVKKKAWRNEIVPLSRRKEKGKGR